eukprot:1157504-Rhodomonas_salina.4
MPCRTPPAPPPPALTPLFLAHATLQGESGERRPRGRERGEEERGRGADLPARGEVGVGCLGLLLRVLFPRQPRAVLLVHTPPALPPPPHASPQVDSAGEKGREGAGVLVQGLDQDDDDAARDKS